MAQRLLGESCDAFRTEGCTSDEETVIDKLHLEHVVNCFDGIVVHCAMPEKRLERDSTKRSTVLRAENSLLVRMWIILNTLHRNEEQTYKGS